ncbi:MAG: hypothetical protein ABIH36_01345 [bacterium]
MTSKSAALLIVLFLYLFIIFSVLFFLYHDGLPTGDSQKAIIWANQILGTKKLPDYSPSQQLLNRDPVDFYTPGLHVITAFVMWFAPALSINPLTSVGLLAILLSLIAAFIAAAIAWQIFPQKTHPILLLLPTFLTLTHFRFLRYLKEPGYHFQNIAGEVLLFGLLFFAIRLIKKWRTREAIFFITVAVALIITHQFSAFIAAFALLPALLIFMISHKKYLTPFLLGLVLIVIVGCSLGLQQKIPHLFTATPHLLDLTPNILDYPQTMGIIWFLTGTAGLILMIKKTSAKQKTDLPAAVFILGTIIILLLSQGPRLGLDIPPVRALLYSVIPLSITASYFVLKLTEYIKQISRAGLRRLAFITLTLFIIIPAASSTAKAYNISHTIRTNSTLTQGQLALIDYLKKQSGGAVLIDDYNRRSASWLVLSGHSMYTRIASDLSRQMDEAHQSAERKSLYLKQLDFEKIFSLGGQPAIAQLMNKHNITWLTGIEKSSSTGFQYNPALAEVTRADDVTLYQAAGGAGKTPGVEEAPTHWLLRASTLANDIGDDEDTFEHLQASLRSTRLSEPEYDGRHTFRTTTSPFIPLQFNVGDYVSVLWDKEKTGRPDTSLELVVLASAGSPVQIITPTGTCLPLPLDGTPVKIGARDVPFDDKGFITIIIDNPLQQPINIDLIALGPARTP